MPIDTRLACTVRPWAGHPLERALSGIRTAGYDAVALPAHGVTEVITPDTRPDDAARVGDLIGEHGLELVVLSHAAALSGSDEEALIAARRQIDHCVRLGVAVLVDMGHPRSDYAADHGVMIGVKPHGGITTTAADCVEAVARVDRDAYRICLDPGNLVHFSGAATADDFALVAPSGPSAVESVNMFDDPARTDTEAATVLHYLRGLLGVSS